MTSPEADADPPGVYGVRNVYFAYGAHPVLADVTLSVRPGEIHALVGRHHEGKSTLCGVLAGRLAPDRGRVVARGAAFPALTPGKAHDMGVAAMTAAPSLYPRLTVLENLTAGDPARWLGFLPRRHYRRSVGRWLAENGIELPLSARMHDTPRDVWPAVEALSKLYRDPGLLVMDEAIEELEQPWLDRILALIRKHLARGMGLLFVTHKIEDALDIADRVSVMRRGNVILTSPAGNMERLNLIRLCYAQLDDHGEAFSRQETFQELMRYTEAMLRDLPTAIVILDPGLNIRFVNRNGRRVLGDSLTSEGGLFGPANARLRELVLAADAGGEDALHHTVPIASGGRKLIADVRIQAIRENAVKVGTMVIVEDVSLREELRRRLVLSEQLASIGLLAAGVAHEVNNPLEIIGNYLTYLRDDAAPETQEILSHMEEEIVRIHEITNNLVAHSGGGRGGETVDVMALARETVGLLRFHGNFRAIAFECVEEDGGKALVRANHSELRQIFLNLIRNSIDAMPDGGGVRITSRATADRVEIRVRDSGPGIDLENPNDAFLPFVSTKKSGGAHQGLGLYIVYGIIEKYGGTITIDNPAEGGCEFRLTFPLAGEE